MRVFNQYILFLVLSACLVNAVLAFTGQDDLAIYFTVNTIVYLTITILHAYFNPRARKSLGAVSLVLFAGFLMVVIIKVIEAI
ncbi:MAG: hypothetical protein PHY28_05600 [Dehalococcoidales bacterium]|nr:hypothetical protein [Dehalococcoidales bacterium]